MRFFWLLVFVAGAAAGIGYPWYSNNFSGKELGVWQAYDPAGGYRSFEATLQAADAPVRVLVDLTVDSEPTFDAGRTVLTLTAAQGGRTVLAETLSFQAATRREVSPQSTQRVYRAEAGIIDPIGAGSYTFQVGPGDRDELQIQRVDVMLRSGATALDPRIQPVGFALMAVGFIGIVVGRRRAKTANPNSQPPPPRWGRDAGG
jgi:hypothetical protein